MNDTTQNPVATAAPLAPMEAAPKKHKSVTLGRFMLTAPQPNPRAGADTPARMYWASYRGNPRIVVHTNDPADAEISYGKITASMDIQTFEVLAMLINKACLAEPGFKDKIVNSSLYKGPQRFDTPQVVNSTLFGKDTDGRIWISLVEDSRPSPRFFFMPGEYHQVIQADGKPLSDAESSVYYAQATMKALGKVLAVLHARSALGDEPDEDGVKLNTEGAAGGGGGWKPNGGGQGGGWKGGQGGGGGGWKGGQGGGGGGWQNRQGGGGGWKPNGGQGGGGGGWQNRQGGGNSYGGGGQSNGGGWQNRQGGGGGAPAAQPANVADADLTF